MLTWNTPAKINLFLNLRRVRDDGYHEIVSVMQTVALYDQLQVAVVDGKSREKISLTTNHQGLEQDSLNNIIVTAYHRFWQATGKDPVEVKVHLDKRIPVEAGMGGGSSDAAAMLLILNRIAQTHLATRDLEAMAATLGSDVPFFIRGGTAIATGRGERIEPLETRVKPFPLLVVKPKSFGISTAIAYQLYRRRRRYQEIDPAQLIDALKDRPPVDDLEPLLINDFENVLFDTYPELDKMALAMKDLGIGRPLLSGSGAAMIGFLSAKPGKTLQKKIQNAFPGDQYEVFVTETLPQPVGTPQLSGRV